MRRPRLALLLVLAFLTALLAPVRVSWSCPDGTPCVESRGHGFVCAGNHCKSPRSCCKVSKPCECKHGALARLSRPAPSRPEIGAADTCRCSVSARPQLSAVTELRAAVSRGQQAALDALLPQPGIRLAAPSAPHGQISASTNGYRPPSLLCPGPARAPPIV